MVHGLFFGGSPRRPGSGAAIAAPALVVGHPADPIHPAADAAMLAEEMPNAEFVRATSIVEWRRRPERLNREAAEFALRLLEHRTRARQRRTSA